MKGATVHSRSAVAASASKRPPPGRSQYRGLWWFLLPGLAFYVFVVIVPSLRGVAYAFTSWDGLSATQEFIGLDNFVAIASDERAVASIRQTLLLTVAMTVGLTFTGLLLALALRALVRTRNLLRVAFFAPVIVAPVMISFLWKYILSPFGALNSLLGWMGLEPVSWLGSPDFALWSIAAVIIWQFSGYSMVIFLAGLQSIPDEVQEAALVDGAGAVKRTWYVTLPLLRPAIIINVTLVLIMGLKQFETVWIMTQGGPGNSTQTIATVMYIEAFTLNNFGYATALAVVLSVVVMVMVGGLNGLAGRGRRI